MAGRQRAFDKQQALDEAMQVFWKKGYVGSSLSDLTSSMGINKPSMYAAFGNKEQLFVQATEHYLEQYAKKYVALLHAEDAPLKQRIKNYMAAALESQCDKSNPKGCYISLCVSESGSEDLPEVAAETIDKAWSYSQEYLADFFDNEKKLGKLASTADSVELALFVITVLHGTAAMARGGKTYNELFPLIDRAADSLPYT